MTELSQAIGELKTLMGQAETELNSLLSGRKASAPRVRASLQKIKTLSHSMRAGVIDYTKSLPVNNRVKKVTPDPSPPISSPATATAQADLDSTTINCPTHAAMKAEEPESQGKSPKKPRKKASKPKP